MLTVRSRNDQHTSDSVFNLQMERFRKIGRNCTDSDLQHDTFSFGIQNIAEIMEKTRPSYTCLIEEIEYFMVKHSIIKQTCIDKVMQSIEQKVSERIRLQKSRDDDLSKDEIMAIYVYTTYGNFATKIRLFFRNANSGITASEIYHFYKAIRSSTNKRSRFDQDTLVYHGVAVKNINIDVKNKIYSGITSCSKSLMIASKFATNQGTCDGIVIVMQICKDTSCLDVEWISPFPEEEIIVFDCPIKQIIGYFKLHQK